MDTTHIDILRTATNDTLPDLDVVVLAALELLADAKLPPVHQPEGRFLVVGSGNAEALGRAIFTGPNALHANESTYQEILTNAQIDEAIVISASGGKHAIGIAEHLKSLGVSTSLYTNNPSAPAAAHVNPSRVVIFPKNREPYTYNTSTYLGMMLGATGEDAVSIHHHITEVVAPRVPDTLGSFDAFYLIVPDFGEAVRSMFTTKFDELFGAIVMGRAFTLEQTKHAKTVVPSETELFISLGLENTTFGEPYARLHIPLPPNAGRGALMAIGYYVIGQIQKQHPAYFKEHITRYAEAASHIFGQPITPIVE